MVPQPCKVQLAEVIAVQQDPSLVRVVETHDQLQDGGFTTPRFPHKGSVVDVELNGEVVKDKSRLVLGVAETDSLELDVALKVFRLQSIVRVCDFWLSVQNGEDSCCRLPSLSDFLECR